MRYVEILPYTAGKEFIYIYIFFVFVFFVSFTD